MILSDRDILQALKNKDIEIAPFSKNYLQPASYDLHLGNQFMVFDTSKNYVIDPKKPIDALMRPIKINKTDPFVLHPGEFALGVVYEKTGVGDQFVGHLEGKSSVGRMGLLIHVAAGFLDPGNSLNMTLHFHNVASLPILLYYKMPIAQMVFEKISSPALVNYTNRKGSKYVGNKKPTPSQMHKNFK